MITKQTLQDMERLRNLFAETLKLLLDTDELRQDLRLDLHIHRASSHINQDDLPEELPEWEHVEYKDKSFRSFQRQSENGSFVVFYNVNENHKTNPSNLV